MATEDIKYWACGCPKPIACVGGEFYIRIELVTQLTIIPVAGSQVTTDAGAIGKFLACNSEGSILWVKEISGTFTPVSKIIMTDGSNPEIKDITKENCCPRCILQRIKSSVTICEGIKPLSKPLPNLLYNTAFNQPYYFHSYPNTNAMKNPNKTNSPNVYNCCHGQFGWTSRKGILTINPTESSSVFITKNGIGPFGDISYPRNQRGRWNQSTTNTKLYPIISVGKRADCRCDWAYTDQTLRTVKQSRRLFSNTNPNISQKQQFAYLTRNRKYLNR